MRVSEGMPKKQKHLHLLEEDNDRGEQINFPATYVTKGVVEHLGTIPYRMFSKESP